MKQVSARIQILGQKERTPIPMKVDGKYGMRSKTGEVLTTFPAGTNGRPSEGTACLIITDYGRQEQEGDYCGWIKGEMYRGADIESIDIGIGSGTRLEIPDLKLSSGEEATLRVRRVRRRVNR